MIFEGHECRIGETTYPLEKLPVQIVVFHGRTLHLKISRAMDEAMCDLLESTPRVMLMYEDGARFRAQRGLVYNIGEDDMIGFISADRFVDGNRREFSRAPLPVSVTVTTSSRSGEVVSTWTGSCTDVSASGIKVPDRGALTPAELTTVELGLKTGEAPLRVGGAIAWRNDSESALTLGCNLESQNQIGELVARWHRARARNQSPSPELLLS